MKALWTDHGIMVPDSWVDLDGSYIVVPWIEAGVRWALPVQKIERTACGVYVSSELTFNPIKG